MLMVYFAEFFFSFISYLAELHWSITL